MAAINRPASNRKRSATGGIGLVLADQQVFGGVEAAAGGESESVGVE